MQRVSYREGCSPDSEGDGRGEGVVVGRMISGEGGRGQGENRGSGGGARLCVFAFQNSGAPTEAGPDI